MCLFFLSSKYAIMLFYIFHYIIKKIACFLSYTSKIFQKISIKIAKKVTFCL